MILNRADKGSRSSYSYYRVFFLSFAIQHSQGKPHLDRDLNFYVVKGYECAVTFLKLVIERLGQTGRLRYGMVRHRFLNFPAL